MISKKISFWQLVLPPIILALITVFIYYPSLHFAFQFDDLPNITKHFNIRHNTFWDLFFSGSRWISYWINAIHYSIGKFDPFSYRVGNVIIHVTNGTLLFFLVYILLSKRNDQSFFSRHAYTLAALTSGLFLLHPAHTQTVSYVIQGQLEGMATLSILLMLLCYVGFSYAQNTFSRACYAIALLLCAAISCGTKEITIVAPALLCLVDWFFIAQGNISSFFSRLWLLGCASVTTFACYLYLLKPAFFKTIFTFNHVLHNNIGNVLTQSHSELIRPYDFFISQFKVILHYLAMYLWPFTMCVEYDWKLSSSIIAPDSFFPFLALCALLLCTAFLLKKNKTDIRAFAALWFFICIAPRASFIPSAELVADYKAYLASIGWLFLIAAAGIALYETITKRAQLSFLNKSIMQKSGPLVALFLLFLPLGIATQKQNKIWSSGLAFWGAMIKNAPKKARAYNNYGVELAQNLGRWKESIPYYQKAIALDKQYPDPCNNLAVAYAQLNDLDNAIIATKKALAIHLNYPEGYNNLGAFYLQKNELDQAIENLQMAIKLRPYYGKAHYNLGRVYLKQKKLEDAWHSFKNCCTQADLDNETGFTCYAQASFGLQKYEDAIFACSKILETNPRHEQALLCMANSYYCLSRFQEAAHTYETLISYHPNNAKALFNAGEAFLKLNNPIQALAWFEKCKKQPDHDQKVNSRLALCKGLINA